MPKYLPFFQRLLRMMYQFFYIVMIVGIVFGLYRQPMPGPKIFLIIAGCLILSYIFRERCKTGVFLLVLHICIGVGVFFIEKNPYIKFLLFMMIFAFFIDGLLYIQAHYVLKRVFEVPWLSFLFGIAVIGLGMYIGDKELEMIGYMMPLLIMFTFLIALYVEGLEEYMNGARRVSGAPMKQIVSTNSLIVTGILSVFVVMIVLGNVLNFDVALKKFLYSVMVIVRVIFTVVLFILKIIFSFLFAGESYVTPPNLDLAEEGESGVLGNILDFIFIGMVIIVVTAFVILFFRWLIRMLLSRQKHNDDVIEELKISSKPKIKKEKYRNDDKLSGRSRDMIARKIYKTKVFSYKRYFTPRKTSTTDDIKELIIKEPILAPKKFFEKPAKQEVDEEILENTRELTEMYNEVRYGEKMPDEAFLKRMKKLKIK